MPKYQHRIELHRLFLVERRGDTLIVSPKGDPAGFANLNFSVEHAALLGLIEKDGYQNVLVDFSASNYFGAKILGALSEWANRVESKGGRFAICELSDDMKELLHIFQFDGQWQQFSTRAEGIGAIVTETPLQKLRFNWKPLTFVACTFLAIGLSFVPWNQYYARKVNQRDFQTVAGIWDDMQKLKAQNAPPIQWRKIQNRAQRELRDILPELEDRAGTETRQARIAQHLLFVSRDYILKQLLVQKDRLDQSRPIGPDKEFFWQMASVHMAKARRLMDGRDPLKVKFPTPGPPNAAAGRQTPGGDAANGDDESPGESHGDNSQHVGPAIAESPTRYPYPHPTPPDEP